MVAIAPVLVLFQPVAQPAAQAPIRAHRARGCPAAAGGIDGLRLAVERGHVPLTAGDEAIYIRSTRLDQPCQRAAGIQSADLREHGIETVGGKAPLQRDRGRVGRLAVAERGGDDQGQGFRLHVLLKAKGGRPNQTIVPAQLAQWIAGMPFQRIGITSILKCFQRFLGVLCLAFGGVPVTTAQRGTRLA